MSRPNAEVSSTTPSSAPVRIGEKLRVARLDRRLSLEETAWRTRIRPDLLRALEEDEFEELGHHAFVKSHLTSYARFLGIDAGELVIELDAMQDEPIPSALEELDRQRRESRKPPRAKWLIAALISVLVLAGASIAGWLGGQAERPATAVTPLPSAAIDEGPVPLTEARVRLRVVALAETQISVLADGEEIFEGVLAEGEQRSFRARDELEILSADAGAVSLVLNNEDLGVAGPEGEIFRGRFGPSGPLDD